MQAAPPRRPTVPSHRRRRKARRRSRPRVADRRAGSASNVVPPLVDARRPPAASGRSSASRPARRCRRRARSGAKRYDLIVRSVLRQRPAGYRPGLAGADLAAARGHRLRPGGDRRRRCSARWSASRSGRCAASTRSSRSCAPCRRWPGCRLSLAAFRDSRPIGDLRDLHHLDLADHHQHGGRRPQHPAGLPQRRAQCCG